MLINSVVSSTYRLTMVVNILKVNQFIRLFNVIKSNKTSFSQCRCISYIQGQSPEPKVREYFYFIDHQGMLFLDDSKMKNFTSCFKDKKFLEFFFRRLKLNNSGRYMEDFPYISLCGRERNFVRCDDFPIVYTHVIKSEEKGYLLSYAHAAELLTVDFKPEKIFMNPETGRVYHPALPHVGGIGLIRSKLAIEFSKYFQFRNGEGSCPTHFTWDGTTYELDSEWYKQALKELSIISENKP